jgi:hypothetical protein
MTQFTVFKKGQEINFDSAFSDIEVAKDYVKENMSFNTFAMDLISKKSLSDKQIAWLHYLATDKLTQSLNNEDVVGEYQPLVEKMYKAVKNNTRKFQLRLPGVNISTIPNGPNAGGLYIFVSGSYCGKISKDGVAHFDTLDEDVVNTLLDANENLLQLAKIYGHETGNCSVCGRTLSDPLSIQMGIGPICAQRF